MVLGMNPRSDNNEAIVNFEDIALDIMQGVEFLRKQPGISKVILIGFFRRRAFDDILSGRRRERAGLLPGRNKSSLNVRTR